MLKMIFHFGHQSDQNVWKLCAEMRQLIVPSSIRGQPQTGPTLEILTGPLCYCLLRYFQPMFSNHAPNKLKLKTFCEYSKVRC